MCSTHLTSKALKLCLMYSTVCTERHFNFLQEILQEDPPFSCFSGRSLFTVMQLATHHDEISIWWMQIWKSVKSHTWNTEKWTTYQSTTPSVGLQRQCPTLQWTPEYFLVMAFFSFASKECLCHSRLLPYLKRELALIKEWISSWRDIN